MSTERGQNRFSLIPLIRRARGYYLYDHHGNRYIDLFQDNGHAVLGHRDKRVSVAVKDVFSKGLVAGLPSVYVKRLARALSVFLPAFQGIIIASSLHRALDRYTTATGHHIAESGITDPLMSDEHDSDRSMMYWRPYCDCDYNRYEAVVPILPFSVCGAPAVICVKKPVGFIGTADVAPFVIAGAVRALYNLQRHEIPVWCGKLVTESATAWKRIGLYLLPNVDEDVYDTIWRGFLSEGFVLSPEFPGPSILPQEISAGEQTRLANALMTISRNVSA